MEEARFNCVWEGSLNVKEKSGSYFTGSPSIFYLGCDKMHCISGTSSGSAAKLSGREKAVFFSDVGEICCTKVEKSFPSVSSKPIGWYALGMLYLAFPAFHSTIVRIGNHQWGYVSSFRIVQKMK